MAWANTQFFQNAKFGSPELLSLCWITNFEFWIQASKGGCVHGKTSMNYYLNAWRIPDSSCSLPKQAVSIPKFGCTSSKSEIQKSEGACSSVKEWGFQLNASEHKSRYLIQYKQLEAQPPLSSAKESNFWVLYLSISVGPHKEQKVKIKKIKTVEIRCI